MEKRPFPWFPVIFPVLKKKVPNIYTMKFCFLSQLVFIWLFPGGSWVGSIHVVEKKSGHWVAPLFFGAQGAKKKANSNTLHLVRVAPPNWLTWRTGGTLTLTLLQEVCEDPKTEAILPDIEGGLLPWEHRTQVDSQACTIPLILHSSCTQSLHCTH